MIRLVVFSLLLYLRLILDLFTVLCQFLIYHLIELNQMIELNWIVCKTDHQLDLKINFTLKCRSCISNVFKNNIKNYQNKSRSKVD